MQTRNFRRVEKWRPVNLDEEARQVSEVGDIHKKMEEVEVKKQMKDAYKSMKERWDKGERDPFMGDTLLGMEISKVAPTEHHADRWQRQHEIYMKIDELNAKGRTLGFETEAWKKNKEEIERLERAL